MNPQDVIRQIGQLKVVPVVAIDDVAAALPLADALTEGGLGVAEITFRTEAGAAVIKKIADQRPKMLLGAGTILTVENLRRARDCGAVFGVAPGFNPRIAEEAVNLSFPFFPGVMTPTDIEAAMAVKISILKFFPAEAAGGLTMLKALGEPYKHAGIRFIPTGGINAENFREYLALDTVLAVGGTWVAKRPDIAAGQWDKIKANCVQIRQALEA
jgi:2-dehydro-3-deoxyphosphogluconate aldolase/(4S)-4-hydroxy-2-oxoglutarate aldolase